jgi:putative ABC transport system permease protein
MFRHYLIAALRNMAATRLQSIIAIFGLSVGLWAAIVAGLLIANQTSFDSFISGSRSLYLVAMKNGMPGIAAPYGKSVPHDLAALLRQNFAQINDATRFEWGRTLMRHGDIRARENIYWADANFFTLLPLPVLYGDRDKALARPDGIVLPLSVARKYFGRDDVVGQTLTLGQKQPHVMTVTAVIADLPQNASNLEHVVPEQAAQGEPGIIASGKAPFSAIADAEKRPNMGDEKGRFNFDVLTILRLVPGTDVAALEERISGLMNARLQLDRKSQVNTRLFRLDQVQIAKELSPGTATRLGIFAAVALLVLVLACVNFVNLSVARAARRGVEVGIRKAVGASRSMLAVQFLGEAVIQALIALLAAIVLVEWSLPSVNAFLQTGAVFDYWRDPALIGLLLLGTLSVGVLAGAYPAFVLSAFRPWLVLKGGMDAMGGAGLVRQILVGLQFGILIVMVAACWVVLGQYRYATRDALRVDTDQMLLVRDDKCGDAFETGVRALPGVRGTACTSAAVLPEWFSAQDVKSQSGVEFRLNQVSVGYGFLELYGLNPMAGRVFARQHSDAVPDDVVPTYTAHYVINETAARKFGFASPQAAIGKPVWFGAPEPVAAPSPKEVLFGSRWGGSKPLNGIVVGVVRDFSLYPNYPVATPVLPIAYSVGWTTPPTKSGFQLLHVKLRGHDIPETLAAIDRLWGRTENGTLMERTFLDSYVQNLVVTLLRQGQAFAILAGIAVLLACLGLFALSIATAQRRTKEIGIRKAMGASSSDIVLLLLWQFLKPVLWAGVIAMPLAWWLMQRWLSGYAYHIALTLWPFLGAAALAAVIALVTVITHAILTARAVPATALRYE